MGMYILQLNEMNNGSMEKTQNNINNGDCNALLTSQV
jgi:hypothetical protein